MYLLNFKSVALPVPKIIGGSQKYLGLPEFLFPHKKNYRPAIQIFPLCALVFPQFSIGVLGEGCETPI